MDGTLLDTERLSTLAWEKAAEKLSFALDYPTIMKMKGGNLQAAEVLFDAFYHGKPSFKVARKARDDFFFDYIAHNPIGILKGGKEILSYLKNKGYLLALATSSRRSYTEQVTKKTGIYAFFDFIVCGDEIKRSKPDPEIFDIASRSLNLPSSSCLIIEDSPNGIRAGHNGNYKVIGIPNVIPFNEETKSFCYKVYNSLEEFLMQIKEGKISLD